MDSQARLFFENYSLDKLMKTIPTGLFMVNTEMQVVYWNAEAERITGYAAAEVIGKHCSFLDGTPCENHCGLFDPAISKPQRGVSCSILNRDKKPVELSKNIDLLYDAAGEIIGGIEAFVDISRLKALQGNLKSEVKQRTEELEQEQRNLSAVLDGMTDLAYICSEDYKIIFMNRVMQNLYDKIASRNCYEVLHGLSQICEDCPLPAVKRGEVVQQERQLPMTGRTYEIIHSPLYQADGRVRKLGVCRDITERLRIETELRQANADLDAFVATVSHDLRSPLTPLIGYSEFLLEEYGQKLDDTAVSCLHEIESTGRRMQALLEDLLTLARVGQIPCPEKPVPLQRVIEEVREELAVMILRKQALIDVGELPGVRVPQSLLVDLLRNLLRNALIYAVDTNPHIEVTGKTVRRSTQLRVIDHGPGIPMEDREKVFEPFQRGDHTPKIPGTGIGLATVRKIARLYNGQAWIESTPGGGVTFVVEFHDAPQEGAGQSAPSGL